MANNEVDNKTDRYILTSVQPLNNHCITITISNYNISDQFSGSHGSTPGDCIIHKEPYTGAGDGDVEGGGDTTPLSSSKYPKVS